MSSKRSISRHIWISAHLGFQAQDSSGQILDLRNIIQVRNIRHIAGLQAHFRFLECLVILSISTSGIPPAHSSFLGFPQVMLDPDTISNTFRNLDLQASGVFRHTPDLQTHFSEHQPNLQVDFFSPAHLRSPVTFPSAFCPDTLEAQSGHTGILQCPGTLWTHRNASWVGRNIVDVQGFLQCPGISGSNKIVRTYFLTDLEDNVISVPLDMSDHQKKSQTRLGSANTSQIDTVLISGHILDLEGLFYNKSGISRSNWVPGASWVCRHIVCHINLIRR